MDEQEEMVAHEEMEVMESTVLRELLVSPVLLLLAVRCQQVSHESQEEQAEQAVQLAGATEQQVQTG